MTLRDYYNKIKTVIEHGIFDQNIDKVIIIIKSMRKKHGRIPLSIILECSHVFCKNNCDLYTPCHVDEWIKVNSELYDSEILFFRDILDECIDDILIDVIPYTDDEINTYNHVFTVNHTDKLRQLYTIVKEDY